MPKRKHFFFSWGLPLGRKKKVMFPTIFCCHETTDKRKPNHLWSTWYCPQESAWFGALLCFEGIDQLSTYQRSKNVYDTLTLNLFIQINMWHVTLISQKPIHRIIDVLTNKKQRKDFIHNYNYWLEDKTHWGIYIFHLTRPYWFLLSIDYKSLDHHSLTIDWTWVEKRC